MIKTEKENIIKTKSFEFSLSIIFLFKKLKEQNEYIISKQLLRSGTSIGANIEEAIAGESKKDFVHKMAIARKEARETKYWLKLLNFSDLVKIDLSNYLSDIDEIIAILVKIIKSSIRSS